jgi:hypothetical protein
MRFCGEAFRVLKPGGRFAVSDVVTRGEVLPEDRKSLLLWVGCVAGSLEENEYRTKLAPAGFEQIDLERTRVTLPQKASYDLIDEGLSFKVSSEKWVCSLSSARNTRSLVLSFNLNLYGFSGWQGQISRCHSGQPATFSM